MEKIKTDIYKSLSRNNGITRLTILVSGIVAVVALIIVFLMHQSHDRYVYGLSKDNSLLPLELIERNDIEDTFKKGDVQYFISLFYTIDQYNYKDQIEKSLWLIDGSGKKLYEEYTRNGHYNKMLQSSSNQYVKDIKVVTNDQGMFKAAFLVVINKPNQKEARTYKIVVEGELGKTKPNYPKNPYGYMIKNFREIQKTEITE